MMPTHMRVKLDGQLLLAGELFGTVDAEEVEWELNLQLSKTGKSAGTGPLWPQLCKEHPEVDVSGLKRKEKDINELLADLQKTTGMHAMDGIEYAKSVREGMG